MNIERLLASIKGHEGFSSKPYECPAGRLTIGYGRNIEDVGITEPEAAVLLQNDINNCTRAAVHLLENFALLDEVRQNVIVEMIYNLGIQGVQGFKKMLRAVELSRFDEAADEMLDSRWAKQVGKRADRLANMMRTGEF